MIKAKICGITDLQDAQMASNLGADALGFIFTKKSPRCLTVKAAAKIISQLDPFMVKVGVFLDEQRSVVLEYATKLGLDVLQFHGSETPAYCNYFRPKFKVVKVLFTGDRPFSERIARYKVDAFLFDIRYEEKLKKSRTLSGVILREISTLIKKGHRVIVSGGLTPKNLTAAKKINPYAIDVASGVEKLVGKKDEQLVELFIKKVKEDMTYGAKRT